MYLRIGQICVRQRIHQKPCHSLQNEAKVLLTVDPGQVVQEQVVGQGLVRARGQVLVQGDDQHLQRGLHRLLPRVVEDQVVVGQDARGLVAAHQVQQGGEQGQRVPVVARRKMPDPAVADGVSLSDRRQIHAL